MNQKELTETFMPISNSNESERADWDIYADFKLKKPLISMVYMKIIQRLSVKIPWYSP